MEGKTLPRGYRLNNFGNLRKTSDKWLGLAETQDDPEFFRFTEPKYGYRALLRLLRNYRTRYGCKTITEMIERYAPPTENATKAYVRAVCARMEITPNCILDVDDRETMCALAAAISYVENGREANMDDVYAGWEALSE